MSINETNVCLPNVIIKFSKYDNLRLYIWVFSDM